MTRNISASIAVLVTCAQINLIAGDYYGDIRADVAILATSAQINTMIGD